MTTRTRLGALLSLSCALLSLACGPEPGSTTDASASESSDSAGTTGATTDASSSGTTGATTGSTGDASSSSTTLMPDPDYLRECQPGDFVCDDWGCENPPVVKLSECYKRCTPDPDAIGEPDPECDEPGRPFCSRVGLAEGGDYDCNGCAHICVSASFNQCDLAVIDECKA